MKIICCFVLVIFSQIGAFSQDTQTAAEKKMKEELFAAFTWQWTFKKPSEKFVSLPESNGYTWVEKSATIKYAIWPGQKDKVLKEIVNDTLNSDEKLLDTFRRHSDNLFFFFVVKKIQSPDKAKYEDMIVMHVFVPQTQYVFALVTAVYPLSLDEAYRKKFIDSALSLRRQE